MAEIAQLKKLNKTQLLSLAATKQTIDQETFKDLTNEQMAEALQPFVTPEEVEAVKNAPKPAADPALAPAEEGHVLNEEEQAAAQQGAPELTPYGNTEATTPEGYPKVIDGIRYEYDSTEPENGPILAVDDATFINLAESPAGYGDSEETALAALRVQQEAEKESQVKSSDPADTPAADDAVNNDIEVGSYVNYPDNESDGGTRRGRVTFVEEGQVEVIWRDGSRRSFPRSRVTVA